MQALNRRSPEAPAGPMPVPRRSEAVSIAAAFLERAPGGLLLVERDGTVALCSSEARTLLGLSAEVVGRPLRHLLSALGRGRAGDRRIALMQLRGPLARDEAVALPLTVAELSLIHI